MRKDKKILGIVPARGGSKGIPGKNIKNIADKPLIWWTIQEAKKCGLLDRTIVSTDDEEISNVAVNCGAEVPFTRPAEISGDNATSVDLVLHAVEYFRQKGEEFDLFVLLQPTSPLRTSEDIRCAIDVLFDREAEMVVSVTRSSSHALWTNELPENGCMKDFLPKRVVNKPRQEMPVVFHPNGAIFAGVIDRLENNRQFYGDRTFAYIMPKERSVDIDDMLDFELAEVLLNRSIRKDHKISEER